MRKFTSKTLLVSLVFLVMFLSACGDDEVTAVNSSASSGNTTSTNASTPLLNATSSSENSRNATAVATEGAQLTGVAFLYVSPLGTTGWSYQHDVARKFLNKLPDVITTYVESVPAGPDAERVMQSMVDLGYKLIITTSYDYSAAVKNIALANPNIKILHCAGSERSANVSTYFGRIYEARYLTGMVAGSMTKTNNIGYVAAFPLPEVIRGINAFTLGVRQVNPTAEVRVFWSKGWYNPAEEKAAAELLINSAHVDVLAHHSNGPTVVEVAESKGIYSIGYHSDMSQYAPKGHLTAAVWNWSPFYKEVVEKLQKGEWEEMDYWKGLEAGVVNIAPCNQIVPQAVQEKVNAQKQAIIDGTFQVFQGPLLDMKGIEKVSADYVLTDDELRSMNWFVNGVVLQEGEEGLELGESVHYSNSTNSTNLTNSTGPTGPTGTAILTNSTLTNSTNPVGSSNSTQP